jgi:hypothetical protein
MDPSKTPPRSQQTVQMSHTSSAHPCDGRTMLLIFSLTHSYGFLLFVVGSSMSLLGLTFATSAQLC